VLAGAGVVTTVEDWDGAGRPFLAVEAAGLGWEERITGARA